MKQEEEEEEEAGRRQQKLHELLRVAIMLPQACAISVLAT